MLDNAAHKKQKEKNEASDSNSSSSDSSDSNSSDSNSSSYDSSDSDSSSSCTDDGPEFDCFLNEAQKKKVQAKRNRTKQRQEIEKKKKEKEKQKKKKEQQKKNSIVKSLFAYEDPTKSELAQICKKVLFIREHVFVPGTKNAKHTERLNTNEKIRKFVQEVLLPMGKEKGIRHFLQITGYDIIDLQAAERLHKVNQAPRGKDARAKFERRQQEAAQQQQQQRQQQQQQQPPMMMMMMGGAAIGAGRGRASGAQPPLSGRGASFGSAVKKK